MIQAGVAWRRRRAAFALPGVQADVVVVPTSGHEGRLGPETLGQFKAEHPTIEPERSVEVRHLEMHVADIHAGIDGRALDLIPRWLQR
jgi:hypothetical protein